MTYSPDREPKAFAKTKFHFFAQTAADSRCLELSAVKKTSVLAKSCLTTLYSEFDQPAKQR